MSMPLSEPIDDKALSVEETFELLNEDGEIDLGKAKPKAKPEDDKEKPEDKPEEEDTEDTSDKEDEDEEVDEDDVDEDELKDIEEELEEVDEEKLELVTPVRRGQILKKYPTLFKDFPYLEKAYYREQQFTEVFPNLDDAKAAAADSATLRNFEEDIVNNGNTANVLKLIKEHNPEKYAEVVDNYLDVLGDIDKEAQHHVIGNLIKHTIIGMVRESRSSGDESLQDAAAILNKYIFGTTKFKMPEKMAKGESPKKEENTVSEREQAFIKQQFDNTVSDLNTKVNNSLKNIVELNIDPKKTMSEWVRKNAVREALDKIQDLTGRDKRFKVNIDNLWLRAAKANFSKESVDLIRRAHLAKAKSIMKPVVNSARNEALKGMGKRVKDTPVDNDLADEAQERPVRRTTERSPSSIKDKAKQIDPKMSTLDYLMKD